MNSLTADDGHNVYACGWWWGGCWGMIGGEDSSFRTDKREVEAKVWISNKRERSSFGADFGWKARSESGSRILADSINAWISAVDPENLSACYG